jgi:WD40 repeat protein/Flp pilus assembly protein TadD
MDEGNLLGALPWFAEALRLDQGDPGREEVHRVRLGAVLRQCPRLVQVWAETDLAQFSPDGQRIVTAHRNGNTARIWDAASGRPLTPPLRVAEGIADVFFQGQRCCAVTANGKAARVWDVVSGEPMTPPLEHDARVKMALFSPDGCRVATWSDGNFVRVWEGTRCRLVTRLADPEVHEAHVPANRIRDVARNARSLKPWFSADSRRLLVPSDKHLQVWDAAEGRHITTLPYTTVGAYSPDGRHLVTAGATLTVDMEGPTGITAQVWDTATGKPLGPPLKHGAAVNWARFRPDGCQVLTVSNDGTVQVWATATGQKLAVPLLHGQAVESAAFSPDGRLVLTRAVAPGGARVVRLWDMTPAEIVPPHKDSRCEVYWAPNCIYARNEADRIVVAGLEGQPLGVVRVLDMLTGQPLTAPLKPSGRPGHWYQGVLAARTVTSLATPGLASGMTQLIRLKVLQDHIAQYNSAVRYAEFSHDRSRLVTRIGDGSSDLDIAQVWDPATGQAVGPPRKGLNANPHLSPDGRRMVTMNGQGTTEVWDVASGRPLGPPLKSTADTRLEQDAAFSPDGRWVVIREGSTVRLWDGRVPQAITLLPQHSDAVARASFSRDSSRLVTASMDGTACVWDVPTGRLLCAPLRHGENVVEAAFSADGRLVATVTAGSRGIMRVWDAVTGEPVTPRFPFADANNSNAPGHVAFSPAGDRLLICGFYPRRREWDVAPDGRPVPDLVSFAEVLSGHRIDPVSGLVPLEGERFQRAWTNLRARYPQSFASSPQDAALAWHVEQSDTYQRQQRWAAAIWHLDHLIPAQPRWMHLNDRGAIYSELRQWDQAIADHSRAIELAGNDNERFSSRSQRANAYAVLGQWDKAAADYARLFEDGQRWNQEHVWFPYTLLKLAVGDAKGYRRACRKLFDGRDRLSGLRNPRAAPRTAYRLVWACVVAADGLEDYAPLLDFAEEAVTLDRRDSYGCARALGGALLRAGRLEAAVQQLEKAASLQPGTPSTSLLLALAHHRLGHADEARQCLDKAVQQMEQLTRQRPKNAGSEATDVAPDELLWTERLSLQLLRREAETLIRGPAEKGKESPAEKR